MGSLSDRRVADQAGLYPTLAEACLVDQVSPFGSNLADEHQMVVACEAFEMLE